MNKHGISPIDKYREFLDQQRVMFPKLLEVNKIANLNNMVSENLTTCPDVRRGTQVSGGRFSKAPETFRARKAIAKSRTLRVQRCFSHIF